MNATPLQATPEGRRRYFVILVFGAVCIAFAPIFVRFSILEPTVTAFWRVLLAVPFLAAATLQFEGKNTVRLAGRQRLWLFFPGFFFALDLAFWHVSILWTTVANATLLANLAPLFVTAAAVVLFGERVSPLFLTGLALAVAGTLLLVGYSFSESPKALLGDLLGVCTAVCYAAYQLSVKRLRGRTPTAQLMLGTCISATLVLAPIAWLLGEAFLPADVFSVALWAPLLGLALLSQCLGQGAIAYALAHLPASLSSVSLLIQPVVATFAAYVLLGESIGALSIAGGMIVLIGVRVARMAAERAQTAPPPA